MFEFIVHNVYFYLDFIFTILSKISIIVSVSFAINDKRILLFFVRKEKKKNLIASLATERNNYWSISKGKCKKIITGRTFKEKHIESKTKKMCMKTICIK